MIRRGNSFSQTLALKERPRNSPLVHSEKIAQAFDIDLVELPLGAQSAIPTCP
jgi:hypothetical protein